MRRNGRCIFAFLFMLLTMMLISLACSDQRSGTDMELAASSVEAVLTTDVGAEIDDQWAMTHLLLSPEIRLRAIITTHASSIGFSSTESAKEANSVLAQVLQESKSEYPTIMPGSNLPLVDASTPRKTAGSDLLIQISQGFSKSQRLVVFITGAADDLCLNALLLADIALVPCLRSCTVGNLPSSRPTASMICRGQYYRGG